MKRTTVLGSERKQKARYGCPGAQPHWAPWQYCGAVPSASWEFVRPNSSWQHSMYYVFCSATVDPFRNRTREAENWWKEVTENRLWVAEAVAGGTRASSHSEGKVFTGLALSGENLTRTQCCPMEVCEQQVRERVTRPPPGETSAATRREAGPSLTQV